MADLLTNATANGAGSGVSVSGSTRVTVPQTSVFGGAAIEIQIADTDTADDYATTGLTFYAAGSYVVDCDGSAYLRAVVSGATATTDVTVTAIS